jgi:hypothetical protein
MKTVLLALVGAGMIFLAGGCASPGYSGGRPTIKFPSEKSTGESSNTIVRGWYWDSRSLVDDINDTLLLDGPSDLTRWNVR